MDNSKKLSKAVIFNQAVSLRLKPKNLTGNHKLLLTQTQINKIKKAKSKGTGIELRISKTQIKKVTGGSLFSLIPTAAKAILPSAAKALGLAGLSFGAESALKKIFGSGFPPEAVYLYNLVQQLSPLQNKAIKDVLVKQGHVVGSGQRGGFLGMLASLGIPLAIELVKKVIGKGVHLQLKGKELHLEKRAAGMRLEPSPPVVRSWKKKKNSWMYL